EEAEADILALAGVSDAGRDATVIDIVRARLPWLMLNLVTATIAVSGVAVFQEEIAQLVALAILMPIVSSLGGNAGTQSLAVAVRALASKELTTANARRIVLREVSVGLVNGLCLALVMGAATYLIFGPEDQHGKLAIIVALALVTNIFTAAVGGILAPLALEKMGRDPAVSSSIFVTFLTDFTGFFAVLLIAALLLH
ncbi:MAG: magnesium transporter, partial [Caulobacter sp. 32-67-35]